MSFQYDSVAHLAAAVAVVALHFPVNLRAQSPADRDGLETLRDSLPAVGEAPSLDRLAEWNGSSTTRLIRQGLVLLRKGSLGTARDPYDEALHRLERALDAEAKWPWGWYALGLTDLAMWDQHFVAKSTPYHGQGISYRRAAMDAFAQAIKTDSSFTQAGEALAGLVVAFGHRRLEQDFGEPLRRANAPSSAPAIVPLARYRLEFGAGRYDNALTLLADYLRRGGDTGVARLEQARTLRALGQASEASTAYLDGARAMGLDGRAEYRVDIAWVASDRELTEYDSLTATEVPSWIDRFWRERDALSLRAAGERLAEHLRRWVFVHQKYLIHRPDDAPIHMEGQTVTEQANFTENFGVATALVLNDLNVTTPNFKAYRRTQWEIDDRGVIYLRHGPPTRVAIDPTGPPNESWQYDMPDGSRIFHFLGSRALGTSAATTMVAALPLQPAMLDSRGGLDSRYSAIASDLQRRIAGMTTAIINDPRVDTTKVWDLRPGSAHASNVAAFMLDQANMPQPSAFHPEVAYKEIARGRSAIAVGVSTDGFPQRFKEDLDAVVQVYGVGFEPGETRRLLAVFAVPGRNLVPTTRSDGGAGIVYPVRIRLIAMDREHGVFRELDTTRVFISRDTLRGDQHLTGFIELRVPPGRYQVRTLVTAPGVNAATGDARDSVEIPPSPKDLLISDLILGRQQSGLSWNYAGERVALNPLNTYPRGGDAELFYEIGGLNVGSSYEVTTSVRRAGSDPKARPDVQSGFEITAGADYQKVTRGVGLANLKPGAYMLDVTVKEAGTDRRVSRSRALNILGR